MKVQINWKINKKTLIFLFAIYLFIKCYLWKWLRCLKLILKWLLIQSRDNNAIDTDRLGLCGECLFSSPWSPPFMALVGRFDRLTTWKINTSAEIKSNHIDLSRTYYREKASTVRGCTGGKHPLVNFYKLFKTWRGAALSGCMQSKQLTLVSEFIPFDFLPPPLVTPRHPYSPSAAFSFVWFVFKKHPSRIYRLIIE